MPDKHLTYQLDNIAIVYQALISKKESHFFRLSLNLVDAVVVDTLQNALRNILPRFPIFRTTLKKGLFWNYLEENFYPPYVHPDYEIALGYNITEHHAYPFRILVYQKRISLETTHLITDGKGATEFLQSLLCEYAYLLGIPIPLDTNIIRPETPFQKEELDDAYKNLIINRSLPKPKKRVGKAFVEPNSNQHPFGVNLVQYRLALDQTLSLAKEYGVSLTTLLTAFYLTAYQDRMFLLPPKRKFRRALRINNPVNLRTFFPTKSLRNFIGFVSHEIDPRLGLFTLKEIIEQVHHAMKHELLDKHFQPFIGQNIRHETTPFLAVIPLFIKQRILKHFHAISMKQETSVLSNLGTFTLPPSLASLVKDVEFIPAPKYINKRDCSVISFDNTLIISITRTCQQDELEQLLFKRLQEANLNPKLFTFYGYEKGRC